MKMKLCRRCGCEKPHSDFHARNDIASGIDSRCKSCSKSRTNEWRRKNREKWNAYTLEKYKSSEGRKVRLAESASRAARLAETREERARESRRRGEMLETTKAYRKAFRQTPEYRERHKIRAQKPERKAAVNERMKLALRTIPKAAVDHRMSCNVRASLKGKKAGRKWESLVGYTVGDLIRHLERQFPAGMSWENMGEWEIDHIVPKSAFSYENDTDPDFKAAWAITNLRPLWKTENRVKHAKRELLL